jgi:nitrogen fixation protein FixH
MNRHAWFGPFLALFILCVGLAGTAALIYAALADPTFGVEPDYDRKALDWNRTAAQRDRNGALGWTISVEPSTGWGEFRVRLNDARGVAVTGASVRGAGFANARSADRFELAFRESAPGRYVAPAPGGAPGSWHLRLEATRGADFFTWEGDAER